MKLLNYQVHNVCKVSELDLNMEGRNLALIGGGNGHGKTSALRAFLMALCGRSGMDWPDIALKEGEDEGSITVNLSGDAELHDLKGFTVKVTLRRKRGGTVAEDFAVYDSTGEEAPSPRELLKRIYSLRAFDPLAFERSKPKEQQELLRNLVGLDFTQLDEDRATVYKERTVVNAAGKAAVAKLDSVPAVEDPPEREESAQDLFKELEAVQVHNRRLDQKHDELMNLIERETELATQEERLKAKLAEIDMERQNLDGLLEEAQKVLDGEEKLDEEVVREKINNVDKINADFRREQERKELAVEVETLRKQSKDMTNQIKAIDEEKQSRLEKADWPLPGLGIDEKGVVLDDLPFEQASKAQRVLASVKIGMALNPKLRLLVCEDGNDLDNETLAALEQTLVDNDFQMLLEFVTRSEEDEERCAVVFYEGRPKDMAAMDTDDMLTEKNDEEESDRPDALFSDDGGAG